MAFGGVNVPSVSGPAFDNTRQKIDDNYVGDRMSDFGELQRQYAESNNDAPLAGSVARFGALHTQQQLDALKREVAGEIHEVTLRNTKKFPFSSSMDSPTTVALTTVRDNLFYTVDVEIVSHTGLVSEIEISDKALNGFKVAYNGSATSVTLRLRIKGGRN